MANYVTGYVIPDVAAVHVKFTHLITSLERLDALSRRGLAPRVTAQLADARRAYLDFNAGLRQASRVGATAATSEMRQKFRETQVRSDTRSAPHLFNLIQSKPLAPIGANIETGAVGVGFIPSLDRAVNANTPGYGTYWRAQEFGTGADSPFGEIPTQRGRVIHGVFTAGGGGDATPPISEYAGGGGPHPVFLPSRSPGAAGRNPLPGALGRSGGGFGTIEYDIRGRHFIRDGSIAALPRWQALVERAQDDAIGRMASIGRL